MDLIPYIHFEKQEGLLCAQHALNALIQDALFSAASLAEIGKRLDEQENALSSGLQRGCNYDDSGFFSIQVIQEALSVFDLELLPWNSREAATAREHPERETAFICNLDQHWFTLRKFAVQWRWYNLNSTLPEPAHVSETYLGMLLHQIQSENYSVFVVKGMLRECEADRRALELPHPATISAPPSGNMSFSGRGYSLLADEDVGMQIAIEGSTKSQQQLDQEEIRRKRLARFGGGGS
ncbi:Josephin-domain-containing protein [Dichotomocladium elegans]|nr:Josephin-domain-containing protein [Dichotomocladium elegans]